MSNGQPTRRERLEAREEAIVGAAHDEFIEHGFEGARMAAIARRAGVAEGTIYLYFRNKNALLGAVVGAFYQRLTGGAQSGVEGRAATADRLEYLVRYHLGQCIREWSVLELAVPIFWKIREYADSEFIGFNRTYVAVFDGVIREGMNRGDIRDDLPMHAIRDLFFGALEHSVRSFLVKGKIPGEEEIDRAAGQFLSMFLPAVGIQAERVSDWAAGAGGADLSAVVQRLESVASRLEGLSGAG